MGWLCQNYSGECGADPAVSLGAQLACIHQGLFMHISIDMAPVLPNFSFCFSLPSFCFSLPSFRKYPNVWRT